MKKYRILPGAAGIIALTATLGFVDKRNETEVDSYSRSNITLVNTMSQKALSDDSPDNRPDSLAYLVEVRRGEIFARVMIDATTGRVLLS